MSVTVLSRVFWTDFSDLHYVKNEKKIQVGKPLAKLVMLAIADNADDFGENSWQSFGTIAEKAGVERRSVIRVVHALMQNDFLLIGGISRYGTNDYKINLEKLGHAPATRDRVGRPKTSDSAVTNLKKTGDPGAKTGDPGAETGDMESPESSFNRPKPFIGADAPPPEWEVAWQLKANVQTVNLPDEEAQNAARLENSVGMFPPAYQDLARAFITATGIFPLAKNVSGWSLAFKDQIAQTGLATQDILDACRQMRRDGLTIKNPFSIMNKVPDIRASRMASEQQARPTAFEKALEQGPLAPMSEENRRRLEEVRARLNFKKPRTAA